ncbi:hypothetical protein ABEI56_04640 [Peribacillus castrilensis]|uniref:hypothetical protein n=1 Tax=Peribacillus castrilensis TaxID=2897690 RepID=UPI003D281F29
MKNTTTIIEGMQENVKSMQEGVSVLQDLMIEMRAEKATEMNLYDEIRKCLNILAGDDK